MVNGVRYRVNNKSRNEYVSSRDSSRLYDKDRNTFADKMRAADNLDDVIKATTSWANDGYLKHKRKDNFVDFLHGDVLIQAGENQYTGDTVVAVTEHGELVFYDVVGMTPTSFKLKEGSPAAASGKNTVSNISADPSDISIPQLNTNDKEILTETSIGDDGNIYLPGQPMPEAVRRMQQQKEDLSQNAGRPERVLEDKPGGLMNRMTQEEIRAVQSIGHKSINDFAEEDFKATEELARRYWVEMREKSPFFRAWFGDWRANDQTPVERATELGNDRGQVQNKDTGWTVNVSRKVFEETKTQNSRNTAMARPYLPYINDIVKKLSCWTAIPWRWEKKNRSTLC